MTRITQTFKQLLVAALFPAAALAGVSARLRRLWAHARLAAEVDGKMPASVVVMGTPSLHGTARIKLGRNLLLYPDLHLETQGEGVIEIGDDVVISRGVHIVAFSRIVIGRGSMIGEYSSLRDANHSRRPGESLRNSGHSSQPIHIGEQVWIGRGVAVLAGCSIGDEATIGANSVVTQHIASRVVAVGAPAKPVAPRTNLRPMAQFQI